MNTASSFPWQGWRRSATLDSFSVLVVEDDGVTRTMLTHLIGRMGFTVFECGAAASAQEILAEQSVDLVLLDLGLPDANGIDLLGTWQQRLIDDEFVVIVVSGEDDEQRMVQALRLGAHDYLVKPIKPNIFMAKVLNAARFHSANRAARYLSQHLSAVVDSVPEGLFIMETKGRVVWCNDQLEQMFGLDGGAVVGLDAASLVSANSEPYEEGDNPSAMPDQSLLKNLGQRQRLVGHHADGRVFPVECMVVGLQGSQERFVVVIRDLRESERVAELERNFVSIVSHELRTPLTSVSGSLSLLSATEASRLSASGVRMLDIARRNVDRLNRLIGDILDLEKIAQGRLVVHAQLQPLLRLLSDAIEMESGGCAAKHITISQVIDVALDNDSCVLVDEDRFRQIMANYLSNAIKFSPESGEIFVCAQVVDDEHIRVSVTDQGPGISQSFRDKVFMPFSQADDPSSRRQGGSGLGLSIVKSLAEGMHGQVGFDSVPGQGASFFVVLLRRNVVGTPMESA